MDGFEFYNPAIYSNALYDNYVYNDILEPLGWIFPDKIEMFNNNNLGDTNNHNTYNITPPCDKNQQSVIVKPLGEGNIKIDCEDKLADNHKSNSEENS